jgi:hypothetical protein
MRIDAPTAKVVVVLALTGLCCVFAPSSRNAVVVAAAPDTQQPSGGAVPCPNVHIDKLDDVGAAAIASHAAEKIDGLPCDAAGMGKPPFSAVALQAGFDYYSWLTFLALNSPADGSLIGKDGRPEWETWKQLPDVMLPDGNEPAAWDPLSNATHPTECDGQYKPGMMVIRMDMEETYNEPFKTGPLFDQNGNYALFVIFMNKTMFEYIDPRSEREKDKKSRTSLYSIATQRAFQGEVNFPGGDPAIGPGSVMVKASWKILTPKDDATKYHTVQGLLYMATRPKNPCRPALLGLIGFHVGHKTSTRQQWIWTTFEHKKNVPTQEDVEKGALTGPYNFYSVTDTDKSHINQTPPGPWDPDNMSPPWDPDHPSTFKSQIVRTGTRAPDVFSDVEKLNQSFQTFLSGKVWENYELITTQWPSNFNCAGYPSPGTLPDPTCSPFPTFLANSTLETFSQPLSTPQPGQNGGIPLATSSCISCHNNAATHHIPATRSDFTFILEKAK